MYSKEIESNYLAFDFVTNYFMDNANKSLKRMKRIFPRWKINVIQNYVKKNNFKWQNEELKNKAFIISKGNLK